jgi:hypothetical protein
LKRGYRSFAVFSFAFFSNVNGVRDKKMIQCDIRDSAEPKQAEEKVRGAKRNTLLSVPLHRTAFTSERQKRNQQVFFQAYLFINIMTIGHRLNIH